jgi:Domain of unknown function (DUF4198)
MKTSRATPAARRAGLAAAVLLAPALALAHNTWMRPLPSTDAGHRVLTLLTGDHYPNSDQGVVPELLVETACQAGNVLERPLRPLPPPTPEAPPRLRTGRPLPGGAALHCWARLKPLDITLADEKVQVYLDDIRAGEATRAAWAARRARGVGFQEVYAKQARLLMPGEGGAMPPAGTVFAQGLDLRFGDAAWPRAGDRVRFQVLRDGKPVAGQPIEIQHDGTPARGWQVSDEGGWVSFPVPLPGLWMLRGTVLQTPQLQPAGGEGPWQSSFLTLVFEVPAR